MTYLFQYELRVSSSRSHFYGLLPVVRCRIFSRVHGLQRRRKKEGRIEGALIAFLHLAFKRASLPPLGSLSHMPSYTLTLIHTGFERVRKVCSKCYSLFCTYQVHQIQELSDLDNHPSSLSLLEACPLFLSHAWALQPPFTLSSALL